MNIILKKFTVSLMTVLLACPALAFAQANNENRGLSAQEEDSFENLPKTVDYVDNNKGQLSLDDFIYLLKLNTKVFDWQNRVVNRYALKKGQRVRVKLTGEEGALKANRYVDSIYILDQQ